MPPFAVQHSKAECSIAKIERLLFSFNAPRYYSHYPIEVGCGKRKAAFGLIPKLCPLEFAMPGSTRRLLLAFDKMGLL
jgi:hypothetical protein